MGWTGIFNWDKRESNKEILEREFFQGETKCEPLAWSEKGAHTWCLYRVKETGKVYAFVIMTQRCGNEFMYKDMGLSSGPYYYDMPKSWLSKIDKDYLEEQFCKEWLERYKKESEASKKNSANFPTWKSLQNLQDLELILKVSCSLGDKGDVVKGYWRNDLQSIICKGYRTNKGRAKKFFESVKTI